MSRHHLCDMNDAFSPYLRTLARGVADDLKIELNEGVFAGFFGTNFETLQPLCFAVWASHAGVSTALRLHSST